MTSRIARGFHRVGIVVAVVPAAPGLWIGVSEWNRQANATAARLLAVKELSDDDLQRIVAGRPTIASLPVPQVADYTTALLLLGLAIALYAGARALGWIVDGFTSRAMP